MQLRRSARRLLLLLILNFILSSTYSLKCRSEDGPSDAELKRVARTCMHKISENSYASKRSNSEGSSGSGQTTNGANANSYYGQQEHDQQYQHGQSKNSKNYNAYDDDNQREENSGNTYRGNNNNNNYERSYSNDMLRNRNRERGQSSHFTRSQRSASVLFNFERGTNGNGRYDQSSNSGRNSNGGGNTNGNGNSNGGSSNRDHRSLGSNSNYFNSNNNNNHDNTSSHDRDRQSQDNACVVHCFFEEMNMLNKDDFPDKHKVSYLLTKDMRDRELRSFYTETIQECFHYLDSQRRRDKCHFSRDLIHCMTEYAKANCADWDDYNIMFN